MTKFKVRIPLTAYVELILDATSADTAFEAAVDAVLANPDQPKLIEWDLHKNVLVDNVFQGVLGTFDVEEIIDGEDDEHDDYEDDTDDDNEEYCLVLESQAISIIKGHVKDAIFFGSFKDCRGMKEALEYSLS